MFVRSKNPALRVPMKLVTRKPPRPKKPDNVHICNQLPAEIMKSFLQGMMHIAKTPDNKIWVRAMRDYSTDSKIYAIDPRTGLIVYRHESNLIRGLQALSNGVVVTWGNEILKGKFTCGYELIIPDGKRGSFKKVVAQMPSDDKLMLDHFALINQNLIASTGGLNISLVDTETSAVIKTLDSPGQYSYSKSIVHENYLLYVSEARLYILNILTGKSSFFSTTSNYDYYNIILTPDCKAIFTDENKTKIFDIKDGDLKLIRELPIREPSYTKVYLHDEALLVVYNKEKHAIELWDISNNQCHCISTVNLKKKLKTDGYARVHHDVHLYDDGNGNICYFSSEDATTGVIYYKRRMDYFKQRKSEVKTAVTSALSKDHDMSRDRKDTAGIISDYAVSSLGLFSSDAKPLDTETILINEKIKELKLSLDQLLKGSVRQGSESYVVRKRDIILQELQEIAAKYSNTKDEIEKIIQAFKSKEEAAVSAVKPMRVGW